jgi:hypothetical protein
VSSFSENIELSMPNLIDILDRSQATVVLIGGMVLEYYVEVGVISKFGRSTSDVDFSIEIMSDKNVYPQIVSELIALGYSLHPDKPYRYLPPKRKIVTDLLYIDLLAHTITENDSDKQQAREIMGIDKGAFFSFEGMDFATFNATSLKNNILIPTPLGFIYLKMISYAENPQRKRDLADIVELVYRICKKDDFNELRELASMYKIQFPEKITKLKDMFNVLANDTGKVFDLSDCEQDLSHRLINTSEEDHGEYFQGYFLTFLIEVLD